MLLTQVLNVILDFSNLDQIQVMTWIAAWVSGPSRLAVITQFQLWFSEPHKIVSIKNPLTHKPKKAILTATTWNVHFMM